MSVNEVNNCHASAWTSRDMTIAALVVLAFWGAAALMWPLTGSVVPWDSKNHFYPMLRYLGAALEHGELPLWNPYHFSGHPSVADPQSLLFTPTMLLFGWLVPSPSMQLFDAVVFAHFLPGAFAILLLFRRRGWHAAGAVVAAMVFILGGSASARLQHTGMIFSYGFFPLALLLLEEALDRRSYLVGALFAVVAAMMTVGRDQVAFLCGLALAGMVVVKICEAEQSIPYLRQRAGVLLTMVFIGGALLAVPALLTMQFLMTSTRPSFGFGVAAMGSLPPESLATVLFGNVFGSLRWTYDYWGPGFDTVAEGTWTDRAINYLFAGTVPALLILWHGIAGRRLFAREFRFFLIVGVLAVLYALGRYTPVFELIFDYLPGINLYRRPADATFLVNIALAFASGYLVHRYLAEGAPRLADLRRSPAGAVFAAAAVALIGAAVAGALAFAIPAKQTANALTEIALAALAAGVAGVIIARLAATPRLRFAAAALIVAFTGGELIWRNAASPLSAEPAERYAVFRELPPEQLQGLQVLKHELAERHARGERPRMEILGLGGAWQNASMVLGLEDTIGYNPLRLADYERAVGAGENAVDPNLRHFPGTFRGYRCSLAGLLGLEYLLLDRPLERLPKHFPRLSGAKLLYGSGAMWVYRLSPSAPRVYLASRLIPVESETVLAQEELPEFDRVDEALIDHLDVERVKGDYGLRDTVTDPDPPQGSAKIASYGRNKVIVDVDTDRNSVVVLHDIYYPGWEAYVDGERRPILRANLLFRGIEVPPGRHRVEFRFRPLSVDNLMAAATDLLASDEAEPETAIQ
jgi:Bacterial membrane protein YfhO